MNAAEAEPIPTQASNGQVPVSWEVNDAKYQLTMLTGSESGAPQILPETASPHLTERLETKKADSTQLAKPEHKGKKRKPSGKKSERERNELVVQRNKRHQDNLNNARGLIFRHKGGVSFVPGPNNPERKPKRKKSKKR